MPVKNGERHLPVTLRMPASLSKRLHALARTQGLSLNDFMTRVLRQENARREEPIVNLRQIVLETLARGHGYDKMSANPPSHDQQMVMAEGELNGMTHSEFLECLSNALDEMLPADDTDFMHDDEIDEGRRYLRGQTESSD